MRTRGSCASSMGRRKSPRARVPHAPAASACSAGHTSGGHRDARHETDRCPPRFATARRSTSLRLVARFSDDAARRAALVTLRPHERQQLRPGSPRRSARAMKRSHSGRAGPTWSGRVCRPRRRPSGRIVRRPCTTLRCVLPARLVDRLLDDRARRRPARGSFGSAAPVLARRSALRRPGYGAARTSWPDAAAPGRTPRDWDPRVPNSRADDSPARASSASARGRARSDPSSACSASFDSIRTRPCEIVWPLASPAALTISITASTAMPCVASSTNAVTLRDISSHLHQAVSVSGRSEAMSCGRPPAERARPSPRRPSSARSRSGRVADDDLIVGLGCARCSSIAFATAVGSVSTALAGRVSRESRPAPAPPRAPRPRPPARRLWLVAGRRSPVHERQAVKRQWVEFEMRPIGPLSVALQADRAVTIRFGGQRPHRLTEFVRPPRPG